MVTSGHAPRSIGTNGERVARPLVRLDGGARLIFVRGSKHNGVMFPWPAGLGLWLVASLRPHRRAGWAAWPSPRRAGAVTPRAAPA